MKYILSVTVLFSILLFTGCKQDDLNSPNQTASLTVIPSDRSQNIPINQKIILSFNKAVDTKIVEENIHLISLSAAMDTNCMYGQAKNHGAMSVIMKDSVKMNHLVEKHSTPGTFMWHGNTHCIFTPDSLLKPQMIYMIHLGSKMMNMMSHDMENMGGMQMGGDMLYHFVTGDQIAGSRLIKELFIPVGLLNK